MSKVESAKDLLRIQGYSGNWDYNEYMFGMYNGMEVVLAVIEDREPEFKARPKKFRCEDIDEKKQRETLVSRFHRAWNKKK